MADPLPFHPPTLLGRLTFRISNPMLTNGPSSADHRGVCAIRRSASGSRRKFTAVNKGNKQAFGQESVPFPDHPPHPDRTFI
jgi:hypothetical protein